LPAKKWREPGPAAPEQRNQRALLRRLNRRCKDEACSRALERMNRFIRQLPAALAVDALMGLEGAAAAVYWPAWARLIRHGWRFNARRRGPPPAPVNMLLSWMGSVLNRDLKAARWERTVVDIACRAPLLLQCDYGLPGGGEEVALVVLQHLQPGFDKGGVILAGLRGDAQRSAHRKAVPAEAARSLVLLRPVLGAAGASGLALVIVMAIGLLGLLGRQILHWGFV
jgi:hypothetical protein